MGERGQINLQHVVVVVFFERAQNARIAARDDLDDFVRLFLVELLCQILVAKPFAPKLLRFIEVLWARHGLAVEHKILVAVEGEFFGLQQFAHVLVLLLQPIQKTKDIDFDAEKRSRRGRAVGAHAQADAALLGKLDGVAEHVNEDLTQLVDIGHDVSRDSADHLHREG